MLRFVVLVNDGGSRSASRSLFTFRAADWSAARARALELGHDHEEDYINSEGDRVVWRFAAIETLDEFSADDLDGIEVYSEPGGDVGDDINLDTTFSPEASEPINTGV